MLLAVYVHRLDPILATVGGLHLWWYGLSYSLGFYNLHRHIMAHRDRLRLSPREVYALSLCVALGVLLGGRIVEVSFDEWAFYRERPDLLPALWLGGMATHGLLAGAAAGAICFSFVYRRPLLELADELVIPGAFLMGIGRV